MTKLTSTGRHRTPASVSCRSHPPPARATKHSAFAWSNPHPPTRTSLKFAAPPTSMMKISSTGRHRTPATPRCRSHPHLTRATGHSAFKGSSPHPPTPVPLKFTALSTPLMKAPSTRRLAHRSRARTGQPRTARKPLHGAASAPSPQRGSPPLLLVYAPGWECTRWESNYPDPVGHYV